MFVLSACTPSANEVSYPVLPDELKDCKFFRVDNGGFPIRVVRCPNSTTSATFQSGKTTKTTVVIDGKEYVEKEQNEKR